MIKQQIYDKMLARRIGMDCSPGIQFQTSLINMEQAKELTMRSQPEKKQQKPCRYGSIKHSLVSSKYFPVGLAIRKAENWPWGWVCLNLNQRKQHKMQQNKRRTNVWQNRTMRRVKIISEVTEDGSFWSEKTLAGLYRIDRIGLIVAAWSYRLDRIV